MGSKFYDHVIRRAGFRSREEAEKAVSGVLDALGDTLSAEDASSIAAELPESFRGRLLSASHRGLTAREFFEEIAEAEHTGLGFAREHAGVVLQAVLTELSPEGKNRLRTAIPTEMSELLEPRSEGTVPPLRTMEGRTTLASGRPGSRHPVSEAKLPLAQSGSVAVSDNPHDDAKLSSSTGLTQERLDETLATGDPSPKRPLDEG